MANLIDSKGFECDMDSAYEIWDKVSDRSAAGWLFLPSDDVELWRILKFEIEEYLEEYDNHRKEVKLFIKKVENKGFHE